MLINKLEHKCKECGVIHELRVLYLGMSEGYQLEYRIKSPGSGERASFHTVGIYPADSERDAKAQALRILKRLSH